MNDSKESLNNTLVALPPHKYPKSIIFFSCLILIAVFYSAKLLPQYIAAAKIMKEGNEAFKSRNYKKAAQLYIHVLDSQPTSFNAKISAAEAIFLAKDVGSYQLAMDLLEGLTLKGSNWDRIRLSLPKNYEQYFTTKKKSKTK